MAGGSLEGGSRAYNSGQAIYKKGSSLTRGRNSPSLSSSTHVNVSAVRSSVSGTNPLETAIAGTSTSVDIESGSRGSSSIVYHRANVSSAAGVSSQPSAASSGHGKAGGSRGSPPSSSTTTTASRHRSMNL